MQFCRSMSTALGIVLAVAAMPAAADWRNFFVQTNPAPSGDALIPDTLLDQELPQDDPIDLPDPITEVNDLPPLTWATNPFRPPSVGRHSIGLDPTDFLGAGTRHYLSVRARVARDGVEHGVPKAT